MTIPRKTADALLDHIYEYGTAAEGVEARLGELCSAVRADERERAAQICTAAMPQPVTNWCDAQIVEALRQCAEAIRNYRAQDKAV